MAALNPNDLLFINCHDPGVRSVPKFVSVGDDSINKIVVALLHRELIVG